MNNKKGFTLVELLAVIVVLGIVASIGIYAITNSIKKAKEKSYQVTINEIERSANDYLLENSGSIPFVSDGDETEYQCVTIKQLIDAAYLKNKVINSQISKDDNVRLDDYIYLERNSRSKVLEKTIYIKSNDTGNNYWSVCQNSVMPPSSNVTPSHEVTINYDANGGNNAPSPTIYTYSANGAINLSTQNPTREGYSFLGWATTDTATEAMYRSGASYNKNNANDVTLFAVWKKYKVTIKYNANGGQMSETHGAAYSLDGNGNILKNNSVFNHTIDHDGQLGSAGLLNYNNANYLNVERSGYSVVSGIEWNTKTDGTGTSYSQNNIYSAIDFCDASSGDCEVTLYVNWTNTVTCTKAFDACPKDDGWQRQTNGCAHYVGKYNGNCQSGYISYNSSRCFKLYNYSECSQGIKKNGKCYLENQTSCQNGWTQE